MIKNYFLITWRNMVNNRLFIMINIAGLSIAIACCIVAYFNWEYNAEYNANHSRAEQIYRVSSIREFEGETTLYGHAPLPLGNAIRENITDLSEVVRLSMSFSNFKREDDLFQSRMAYVDPGFFNVFSFDMIAGDASTLKDPSRVFLSDEMALKIFGSTAVVGNQLTQVIGGELKEYLIGGVFRKQPDNSSFNFAAYTHYDNFFAEVKDLDENDWKSRNTLFVMINDPSRLEEISRQLQTYRENNNRVREDFLIKEFVLDPFVGMARRDSDNDTWSMVMSASPKEAVISPIIMAVLLLLIACFNMTNTSIAISSRRLKEIGIRKVMGSLRSQLIVQFLAETAFVCFIAVLLGLLMGEVLLNAWNALWENMKLTSHYLDNPGFVIFIGSTLLLTALVAGGYPAFYISHFKPVSILKGKLRFGGTNLFTRILLGLQYSISLVSIVFAIAFYLNSIYQQEFDIGFERNGVIMAYVDNRSEFETYRNALASNTDIISIAGSKHSIFSARYNDPVKHESRQLEAEIIDVGDEYLKTMGLTLEEGRDFVKDSENDRRESVIVTRGFAKAFGWDSPLGKEIIWMDTVRLYVIGVVSDVYTQGLWREMDPMMIRLTSPDHYTHVIVRAPAEDLKSVNTFMEERWKEVFPNRLYNGWYINEGMAEATTVNDNIVKIFAFTGVVALLLSITGLFSLVSLNIIKKMKEIGVRKVLGASIVNITRIINLEFFIILVLSAIVGVGLSAFAVEALMSSIWRYYQAPSVFAFGSSVLIMFACSAAAIGYKVFAAASLNPVNTLRDE